MCCHLLHSSKTHATIEVCRAGLRHCTVYSVHRILLAGLARTMYVRCIYGILGKKIAICTVIYGVYIRFWPTLLIGRESFRYQNQKA